MDYYSPYKPQTTGGGWTCPRCGVFVDGTNPHTCPAGSYVTTQITTADVWERIASALERIAFVLESQNR